MSTKPVTVAKYLTDHRVTVAIPNLAAAKVIAMLCESGGWRAEKHDAEFVIERPQVHPATELALLLSTLRPVFPLDYQAFLGLDDRAREWGEVTASADPADTLSRQSQWGRVRNQRIKDAARQAADRFVLAIADPLLRGESVSYTKMTVTEKQLLVEAMTLDALSSMADGVAIEALSGQPPLYCRDIAHATVRMNGRSITINAIAPNGWHTAYGIGLSQPAPIKRP